jgi:hypothetical protein
VKGIASSNELESPVRQRQVLDSTYPPLDVRQAGPPLDAKAPNADHVRLLVHRQDLLELSGQGKRHLTGPTSQVKELAPSGNPGSSGQACQQAGRVGGPVPLVVLCGAAVEVVPEAKLVRHAIIVARPLSWPGPGRSTFRRSYIVELCKSLSHAPSTLTDRRAASRNGVQPCAHR